MRPSLSVLINLDPASLPVSVVGFIDPHLTTPTTSMNRGGHLDAYRILVAVEVTRQERHWLKVGHSQQSVPGRWALSTFPHYHRVGVVL